MLLKPIEGNCVQQNRTETVFFAQGMEKGELMLKRRLLPGLGKSGALKCWWERGRLRGGGFPKKGGEFLELQGSICSFQTCLEHA